MDDKITTRDYPQSGGYPQTGGYTQTGPKIPQEPQIEKKPNAFVRFFGFVFVKDFGIKAAAILTGAVMFLLMTGLQ